MSSDVTVETLPQTRLTYALSKKDCEFHSSLLDINGKAGGQIV